MYPEVGIRVICGLFGKSRHAYYKQQWAEEGLIMRDELILKLVKEIRVEMPRIGTRKLHFLLAQTLEQHKIEIGRDKLFDLISDYGMLVRRRKRRKIYTTDSNHPFWKYPNLIKELEIVAPQQVWVSDITYISLSNSFVYLNLIADAYSRKIIGYCLYPTLERFGSIKALEMALSQFNSSKHGLIHHSDKGKQYCSSDYIQLLNEYRIIPSMTEKSDPYENAIAERVNGILKSEFGLGNTFKTFEEAKQAIDVAIKTYNEKRPHLSCNYLTPFQAHQVQGKLRIIWKKEIVIANGK